MVIVGRGGIDLITPNDRMQISGGEDMIGQSSPVARFPDLPAPTTRLHPTRCGPISAHPMESLLPDPCNFRESRNNRGLREWISREDGWFIAAVLVDR